MDLGGEHQQVEFPLIGTNMKKIFAGCTISKILFLAAFNVISEYISQAGLPQYTLSTKKSMPVPQAFVNVSLMTTSTLASEIALQKTTVTLKSDRMKPNPQKTRGLVIKGENA